MIPPSPEVRFHMATAAFTEDEPVKIREVGEISEETADTIALAFEALLFAAAVVIVALVIWSVWS